MNLKEEMKRPVPMMIMMLMIMIISEAASASFEKETMFVGSLEMSFLVSGKQTSSFVKQKPASFFHS